MDRKIGSSPSALPPAEALDAVAANASSRQLFAQFKQLLEAAKAKVSGYHELHSLLQNEQRSVGQLERALHLQQRHIDRFTAQDLLVSQLTQQLTVQSQAVERLQSSCSQRLQQLEECQAHASALQQEVGQKRKRIDSLMEHGMYQDKRIRGLEKKLQQYKSLCSYVASESQEIGMSPHAEAKSPDRLSAETVLQDSSLAEGAAGLLAMTSTADHAKDMQIDVGMQHSSDSRGPPLHAPLARTESSNKNSSDLILMEPRCGTAPKRASCLIIGRHPQVPREVRVICKQLMGRLQLGECCQHLTILAPGNELMSPPEFEAAAGCSKGKNWKANIKVQGNNGKNQMLKLWLPGLMQLVGDHAKAAVAKDVHINTLLDSKSGLRIIPSDNE
ncbi:hypothetical protein ABBQ38_006799 [Trebouxia sp. C0009 RCD-2024]